MATVERNDPDGNIAAALAGIRTRLDTLASITPENILIPGGPQERYHQIGEESYAALGLIETQVDELRVELEYQHQRLEARKSGSVRRGDRQEKRRPATASEQERTNDYALDWTPNGRS